MNSRLFFTFANLNFNSLYSNFAERKKFPCHKKLTMYLFLSAPFLRRFVNSKNYDLKFRNFMNVFLTDITF